MWNRNRSIPWNLTLRTDWIKINLAVIAVVMPIYILNRIYKTHIQNEVLSYICVAHLNDFIGGMVFCVYLNLVLILARKQPLTRFSVIMVVMLAVALLWEYFFPLFLPYSTSDIFDVCAYMLGAIVYCLVVEKLVKAKASKASEEDN